MVAQTLKKCPADSRSGRWGASAFHGRSDAIAEPSQSVPIAAGLVAFRTVPSGIVMSSGRKNPSFVSASGSVIAWKNDRISETDAAYGALIGPCVSGSLPV